MKAKGIISICKYFKNQTFELYGGDGLVGPNDVAVKAANEGLSPTKISCVGNINGT